MFGYVNNISYTDDLKGHIKPFLYLRISWIEKRNDGKNQVDVIPFIKEKKKKKKSKTYFVIHLKFFNYIVTCTQHTYIEHQHTYKWYQPEVNHNQFVFNEPASNFRFKTLHEKKKLFIDFNEIYFKTWTHPCLLLTDRLDIRYFYYILLHMNKSITYIETIMEGRKRNAKKYRCSSIWRHARDLI